MKRLAVFMVVAALFVACAEAAKEGSSPKVPKADIEKAADTKIPDAGPDSGNAAPAQ